MNTTDEWIIITPDLHAKYAPKLATDYYQDYNGEWRSILIIPNDLEFHPTNTYRRRNPDFKGKEGDEKCIVNTELSGICASPAKDSSTQVIPSPAPEDTNGAQDLLGKILGVPAMEYIYEQFPETVGHIPLNEWFDELDNRLINQQQKLTQLKAQTVVMREVLLKCKNYFTKAYNLDQRFIPRLRHIDEALSFTAGREYQEKFEHVQSELSDYKDLCKDLLWDEGMNEGNKSMINKILNPIPQPKDKTV